MDKVSERFEIRREAGWVDIYHWCRRFYNSKAGQCWKRMKERYDNDKG